MFHERFEDAFCRRGDGDRQRRCLLRGGLSIALVSLAALANGPIARAEAPVSLSPSASPLDVSPDQAKASVQWLADLAMEKAPRTVSGDKDWGDQKKRWSGVKVKLDGLRLKTHRRFREVNHGRWMRYEATLPDPGTPGSAVATVQDVRRVRDPITSQPRWQIVSSVTTPMKFTARIQRWNWGLKLYSVTIEGEMRVRLDSTCSIDFIADYTDVPPALVIDPRVDRAVLTLERFEVDRVSKIGGDVAEEWGEWMEDVIRSRFLEKQNEKLATKLNASIERERDSLRLSLSEWLSDW